MARVTIDTQKCICCGDCAAICPVLVYNRITPPCQIACPIGTDVEGYTSLIAQGRFAEALELNRQVNPLPLVAGRICTHPCEVKCHRGEIDEAVAICSLKRFVGDHQQGQGVRHRPERVPQTRAEKVAVIGSGPAGLAAAHSLVRTGYGVTVFEAESAAGGMLIWGIPEFRLPREVVELELDDLQSLGVTIKLNTPIGGALSVDELFAQGYGAVLIAVGAQKCRDLGVPGESGGGVVHCLELMRQLRRGKNVPIGREVVVIGGGNVAIDGARTALRLGAHRVTVVCLESRWQMPAGGDEIKAAEEEGITILPSRQCDRIIRTGKKVTGLQCKRLASMRFEEGRLITEPIAGSEHIIAADMVLVAAGQGADVGSVLGLSPNEVSANGRVIIDPLTMAARRRGIYAAGDAVSGPATVIEAIASGKEAAASIDGYFRGSPPAARTAAEARVPGIGEIWGQVTKTQRKATHQVPLPERLSSFKEVDLGFDGDDAVAEARRCLGCGVFGTIDVPNCCGLTCALCMDNCWKKAISISNQGSL